MPQQDFQKALARLVNDQDYRQQVEANPTQLTSDYNLSDSELGILVAVWEATGTAPEVSGQLIIACCCCCC